MRFSWSESSRSELRGVDREYAMRILTALTRYSETGEGDIKALSGAGMDISDVVSGTFGSSSKSPQKRLQLFAHDIDPTCIGRRESAGFMVGFPYPGLAGVFPLWRVARFSPKCPSSMGW